MPMEMGRIEVLDTALADQIAAGEVVERPASVVKELVENALDAGATDLQLELDDGGVGLIEVRDNGHGMGAADAVLALRRHATSKLRSFDDLLRLETLGFRGEALPSIASVSKLELRTRTADEEVGTQVIVEAGAEASVRPIGCPVGTVIRVRDLFFNVPARRKFLKTKTTENNQVAQVLRRVALARPGLRLRLVREGRTALEFLPTDDMGQRLRAMFPRDSFTRIEQRRAPLALRAWLTSAAAAKSGTRRLYLFVNGRPVQDGKLARAVARAFGEQLSKGRYPSGAVFIELDPSLVDVNVHPQKSEVRFSNEGELLRTFASMITTGLFERAAKPPARPRAAPTDAPALPRSKGFWNDRLGLGKLEDGKKIGTATAFRQDTRPRPRQRAERGPDPATPKEISGEPTRAPRPAAPSMVSEDRPGSAPPPAEPAPRPKPERRSTSTPTRREARPAPEALGVGEEASLRDRLQAALGRPDAGDRRPDLAAVLRIVTHELGAATQALRRQSKALDAQGLDDAARSLREVAEAIEARAGIDS